MDMEPGWLWVVALFHVESRSLCQAPVSPFGLRCPNSEASTAVIWAKPAPSESVRHARPLGGSSALETCRLVSYDQRP